MKALKALAELTIGRVIIIALFVTAGYYFSYFDAGEELDTLITRLNAEVSREEARTKDIQKTVKKEEEMRGSVMQLQRNLEVVKSKIPVDLKEYEMTSIINGAATSSGVTIRSLSSIQDPNRVANAAPRQINISEVKPENLIDEVKFNISLNGTFESFIKFIDFLAKEDKVIKLRNFTIKRLNDQADENKIDFNGEIVGFKQANIQIIQGTK